MATYCEYLAAKYLQTPTIANNEVLTMHAEAKKGTGSVYCYDTTDVGRIFSSPITYNKGGSVVRVLHYLLGDSLFFQVLKEYQTKFAFKTASTNDFRLLVNEVSKQNFDTFFDTWIYKRGWPTYNAKWNQKDSLFYMQMSQDNYEETTNLFDIKLPVRMVFTDGSDSTIYVRQKDALSFHTFLTSKRVQSVSIDQESWILKNVTLKFDPTLNGNSEILAEPTAWIYPNPVHDKLFVGSDRQEIKAITIWDYTGKLVLKEKLNGNNWVDVSNLFDGIYMIEMELKQGSSIHEAFLVNHR